MSIRWKSITISLIAMITTISTIAIISIEIGRLTTSFVRVGRVGLVRRIALAPCIREFLGVLIVVLLIAIVILANWFLSARIIIPGILPRLTLKVALRVLQGLRRVVAA